ncbi:hypothetical protein N0V82_008393 [Gnomoniopsis sp. IMI 355080]|nr:hypothetical protein N0V82_008393 [Gnomoniopsis sp. IMI 355080]
MCKNQYSEELIGMTNAFASRQIEHISLLTKELHEGTAGESMPPTFTALIQQTVSLHMRSPEGPTDDYGLEGMLKLVPLHKTKSFVENLQVIMRRANSFADLLPLVERQNEQRKAEALVALERKAIEERVQEFMAEDARLKEALKYRRSRSPSSLWCGGFRDTSHRHNQFKTERQH